VQRNYRTLGSGPTKRIENAYLLKLDHSFGSANRLSFTYSQNGVWYDNGYDQDPSNPDNFGGRLAYPIAGRIYYRGAQYYGKVARINDTHLFTPTLVNTLTLAFHRLTHP
jgi:hypothetical protein